MFTRHGGNTVPCAFFTEFSKVFSTVPSISQSGAFTEHPKVAPVHARLMKAQRIGMVWVCIHTNRACLRSNWNSDFHLGIY